ncbi:MAG: hypothetical protein V4858_22260 [Pseudomonadota bacterium]
MMNTSKLLIPAVMLTASFAASAIPVSRATLSDTPRADVQRTLMPAVMGTRAPDSFPVPKRLQDYTDSKAELFAMRKECTGIRCGSISGSGSGWDDSDQ